MLILTDLKNKSLEELQNLFIHKVNCVICPIAKKENWCIYLNHCVIRCLLDNLFNDCWYNYLNRLSKTPAYKQLNKKQLIKLHLLLLLIETKGNGYLVQLNNNSLNWRTK